MKSIISKFALVFVLGAGFLSACSNVEENNGKTGSEEVKNVNLSGGEELIKTHCITCHTLGYIDMQPDFPRKTWEKITEKMIKSYGAPIPDSAITGIVDYLVAVKGLKE